MHPEKWHLYGDLPFMFYFKVASFSSYQVSFDLVYVIKIHFCIPFGQVLTVFLFFSICSHLRWTKQWGYGTCLASLVWRSFHTVTTVSSWHVMFLPHRFGLWNIDISRSSVRHYSHIFVGLPWHSNLHPF